MADQQTACAVGVFEKQEQAAAAVRALMAAGFPPAEIVIAARDWRGHDLVGNAGIERYILAIRAVINRLGAEGIAHSGDVSGYGAVAKRH